MVQGSWAGRGLAALAFGAMSQPLARSLHWAGPALGHRFVLLVVGFPALQETAKGEECGVYMAC